jgi:phosphoglycolate phosphatase
VTAFRCRLLLLDLDGTLVDSAPDLHRAACVLLQRRELPAIDYESFRTRVSRGGIAMLQHAFPNLTADEATTLLPEFLACYAESIAADSTVFPGMQDVLDQLASAGARWGIVTNKPEALAAALLRGLGLDATCAVLIGGDTLAVKKPDPAPLLEACRRVGESVSECVYVGDDPRDILASRAACMPSIAAAWGYVDADADLLSWGADGIAAEPGDLLRFLELAPPNG